MTKIVGYKIQSGTFNDESGKFIDFNNIVFYVVSDEVSTDCGLWAGMCKGKVNAVTFVGCKNVSECLNKEVIMVPDLVNPKYIAKVVLV